MKTLLIFLLCCTTALAQSIDFSIQQDPKLAFVGDGQTSKNHTLNFISRVTFNSFPKRNQNHFWSLLLSFEYADLNSTFQRYSAGVGYNLKLSDKLTGSLIYDLGVISRGTNYTRATKPLYLFASSSFQGNLKWQVGKRWGLMATSQFSQRKDYLFYDSRNIESGKWMYSHFAGGYFIF